MSARAKQRRSLELARAVAVVVEHDATGLRLTAFKAEEDAGQRFVVEGFDRKLGLLEIWKKLFLIVERVAEVEPRRPYKLFNQFVDFFHYIYFKIVSATCLNEQRF